MVVWIVGHSDRTAADKAWAAVEGDAEWKAQRQEKGNVEVIIPSRPCDPPRGD